MRKKKLSDRALKFETLQLHVGQEQADPVTDARAVMIETLGNPAKYDPVVDRHGKCGGYH